VIGECLQEMAPEMNRRGIRWTVPAEEAPAIQAHTAMLRQILISLLANAIDVMPEGGDIAIHWTEHAGFLKLQLVDSGPGLRKTCAMPCFAPFSAPRVVDWALAWRWSNAWSSSGAARSLFSPRQSKEPVFY
jgi:two-component system sensor histidine kinase HydH